MTDFRDETGRPDEAGYPGSGASAAAMTPVAPAPVGGAVPAGALWPPVAPPPAVADPSYPELVPPVEPLPLLVILPDRAKQRRWTVLLRAILAIPLAVVVIAVGIAAFVCVVLGWFAALVLGRAPAFVRTIVTVYLRVILRFEAYVFLLTDRFPPFGVEEVPADQARLAVPPATPLHRAAVLFRLILVIPAAIAVRIVGLGVYVVSFFAWLVVLVTGWLPKPVHEVFGAFIRYELRLVAYLSLLVPTNPCEVFGDLALPVPTLVPGGDPSGISLDTSEPATPPRPWMLVLSMGAKRFLVVTIVLGIGAAIGLGVLETSVQNHADLVQVNNQLVSNLNQFVATTSNCQTVACLEQADEVLSNQLGTFADSVESSNHAGVSENLVIGVAVAALNTQRMTAGMANAGPSLSDYRNAAASLRYEQSFAALRTAQHRFVSALNAQGLG